MDRSISSLSGLEKDAQILSEEDWSALCEEHERIIGPYIDAYRDRRSRRQTHPVHDFLFAYYQTNRTVLRNWRPSWSQILAGEKADGFLSDARYRRGEYGVMLDPQQLDDASRDRLQWSLRLIRSAMERPARFNCFGLHEWAMVYKADTIRHEKTPLRVTPEEVKSVVESSVIRCTHWDAYRFFTPEAVPLNTVKPSGDTRHLNEQFGCIHFNMDLYRWSYKASPWVGSELLRDCFLFALEARELDMRASPYDLSEYDYAPIRIETAEGRELYRVAQHELYLKGQGLAARFVEEVEAVLHASR